MWNQRSVDTFLGLPFNIASYGLLLMMIADEVGMVPDELIGNLGDVHLYESHVEQALEQIKRIPFDFCKLNIKNSYSEIDQYQFNDFEILDYQSHQGIKAEMVA